MTIALSLYGDFCLRLTLTLLHFLWQGVAVALFALAGGAALRRAGAAVRYWVFVAALALLALCPSVTLLMLAPKTHYRPNWNPFEQVLPPISGDMIPLKPPVTPGSAAPTFAPAEARPRERGITPSHHLLKDRLLSLVSPESWRRAAPWVAVGYFSGVLLMLARLLLALRGGRGLRGQSQSVTESTLLASLERASQAVRLRVTPAVAWCQRVAVPTVVGILKPTILLPLSLTSGLSAAQVEMLLLHELAHLRRLDHWVNLAQWLIETMLFFHPAVWLISRRIRAERELACDDMVLTAGVGRAAYADSLLRMAELSRAVAPDPSAALALGSHGPHRSGFGQRVLRLIEGRESATSIRPARIWPVGIVLLLLLLGSCSVAFKKIAPVAQQAPPKQSIPTLNNDRDPAFLTGSPPVTDSKEKTWAATASVAEVLEKIRNDERWLWKAHSVLIESNSQWNSNPEYIKRLAEQPQKGKARFRTDMPAELQVKDLVAWDAHHIVTVNDWSPEYVLRSLYNGTQFYSHTISSKNGGDQDSLDTTITNHFGSWTLAGLVTGRISYPDTWWIRSDPSALRSQYETPAGQVKDLGIRERDGHRYRVLLTLQQNQHHDYWIDLQTGRLAIFQILHRYPSKMASDPNYIETRFNARFDRYLERSIVDPGVRRKVQVSIAQLRRNDPQWLKRYLTISRRKAKERSKGETTEAREIDATNIWIDTMKEMDILGAEAEPIRAAMLGRIRQGETPWRDAAEEESAADELPYLEFRLSDWRDVGGGRYFPFSQDYSVWSTSEPDNRQKTRDCIMRVTRLALDEPLPEDLFSVDLKEGVPVFDQRGMPPRSYKYKKQFSKEEWDKILIDAEKIPFIDSRVQKAQQAMVGEAAPEIRAQRWANGGPLSLKALKGKYVVLHFFAEGADPRADDTARWVELERQWRKRGVTVIGVHTARAGEAELQDYLKKKGIQCPVAVDQPRDGTYGFGQTFAEYKVIAVPHTILVDADGVILVHDKLSKVAEILKKRVP